MDAVNRIEWTTEVGRLVALEPTLAEVTAHASALAEGYNEPANAELMGHTQAIAPAEVVENYRDLAAAGARQFLLLRDGALMGDADLRGIRGGAAELAFMIGAPSAQGKGLGTRFALMVTAFGFTELGLARVFASVVPHNTASRRVFEKLGYAVDGGVEARGYADEPDDVVYAIDRAAFARANAAVLPAIAIHRR